MKNNLRVIILAAGRGTRMKSETPKLLHKVCGKPLLAYVLDIATSLRSLKTYIVTGFGAEKIKETIGDSFDFVLQPRLLGTGDAVVCCASHFRNYNGDVLVLCGDTPLLSRPLVVALLKKHQQTRAVATLMTAYVDKPQGYGRIVRDGKNRLLAIREEKDASGQERQINEINVGVYCFKSRVLFETLKKVRLNPKKKEYYLTDVIELLLRAGGHLETVATHDARVAWGVNTRQDLAQAQAIIRQRILNQLMAGGVTIVDPATTFIEADVRIGADTIIHPMSVIHRNVRIGKNCSIGPLARIRPGSRISDGVEIGNFTEVSRSSLGRGVFMKHFSFLGDAHVGPKVNIGAGVVTANYDGVNKNKTIIGPGAFVGSDAIVVAPARIGAGALIGAGSLVTKGKNIPAKTVAVGVPARVIRKIKG